MVGLWTPMFALAGLLPPAPTLAEPAKTMSAYCSVRVLKYVGGTLMTRESVEYASPVFDIPIEDYDAPLGNWTYGAYSASFVKAAFPNNDLPEGAEHGCYAFPLSSVESERFSHMHVGKKVEVPWQATSADVEAARAYNRRQAADRASLKSPIDGYVYCYLSYKASRFTEFSDSAVFYTSIVPMSTNSEARVAMYDRFGQSYRLAHPDINAKLSNYESTQWKKDSGDFNCKSAETRDEAERVMKRSIRFDEGFGFEPKKVVMTGWKPTDEEFAAIIGVPVPAPPQVAPAAILVAESSETARRAAAEAEREKIVAADKQRRAAVSAAARAKDDADRAQTKARQAARAAEFRAKCPSLMCQ